MWWGVSLFFLFFFFFFVFVGMRSRHSLFYCHCYLICPLLISLPFLNENGNFNLVKAASGAYERIRGGECGEEVKELCYRLMDKVVSSFVYCFTYFVLFFSLRMRRIDQQPRR
jgi:hypothetical protein